MRPIKPEPTTLIHDAGVRDLAPGRPAPPISPEAEEPAVFVAADGARARRLRLVGRAVAALVALWLVALVAGTLGFGSLPGLSGLPSLQHPFGGADHARSVAHKKGADAARRARVVAAQQRARARARQLARGKARRRAAGQTGSSPAAGSGPAATPPATVQNPGTGRANAPGQLKPAPASSKRQQAPGQVRHQGTSSVPSTKPVSPGQAKARGKALSAPAA